MNTRKYSEMQEKEIAKWLDGKVVPNSGAIKFGSGDVLTNAFCIEAKTVTAPKESISIKKEWIAAAKKEALAAGKTSWAIAIRFEPFGEDYYIIDKYDMRALKDLEDLNI